MNSETITTICLTIFASSGFWGFITAFIQSRGEAKSATREMLKGLGHDRICELGEKSIAKGYVTRDEYENLHDYLFVPYKKLGGNGTAEKVMNDVKKLPIRDGATN